MDAEFLRRINGHLLALSISSSTVSDLSERCSSSLSVPENVLRKIEDHIKCQQSEVKEIKELLKKEKE